MWIGRGGDRREGEEEEGWVRRKMWGWGGGGE